MWAEDLNLSSLDEQNEWKEFSEEDKEQVKEDGKKAKQARKKIQNSQIKWKEIAIFLSKILWRYYDNWIIINIIHSFLINIEKEQKNLIFIFDPFIEENHNFHKINDYIIYIKENIKKLKKDHINLIINIIEFEKLWWELFWETLKKDEVNYTNFIKELEKELKS